MKREIVKTADGSSTIYFPEQQESYHSRHGAVQEAYHVFIDAGFSIIKESELRILEIGFGTGLNAFITLLEAEKRKKVVHYEGIEAYPVPAEELQLLNYPEVMEAPAPLFDALHEAAWEDYVAIIPFFRLKKRQQRIEDIADKNRFNLIYFDAFGARTQPELWTEEIFGCMFDALEPGGTLVTYAARGSVRRAMLQLGFLVERLPGPPGKREMLRAVKPV